MRRLGISTITDIFNLKEGAVYRGNGVWTPKNRMNPAKKRKKKD